MINKVTLYGNVGRSPEVFLTQDGREIATFALATSVYWKDKIGEWQSATDWHRITVFREATVGWIKNSLRRGDKVFVEGKLTYHYWTDKLGKERRTAHVVVSGFGGKFERLSQASSYSQLCPQDGDVIPDTKQNSPSSHTENEGIHSSFDLPKENSLSAQSYHHIKINEDEGKKQEESYHKGVTAYED